MDKRHSDRKNGLAQGKPSGHWVGSPFVGRDKELRHIAAALSLAAKGQGSTVLLTGQPGIGKSRLAKESLSGERSWLTFARRTRLSSSGRLGVRITRGCLSAPVAQL